VGEPRPVDAARLASSLARGLRDVASAVGHARSVGVPVAVPEPLYLACLEIVSLHDEPSLTTSLTGARQLPRTGDAAGLGRDGSNGGTSRQRPGQALAPVPLHDIPLRRLVWQVLDPGYEFSVADVVSRLAGLGLNHPANKVSNALGYWVSRGRLERRRKGVYACPASVEPIEDFPEEIQQESPAGNRAIARRKETSSSGVPEKKRQAM
jgi:hypothetical protein